MQTVRTRHTFIEVSGESNFLPSGKPHRRRRNSCPGYFEPHFSEWETLSTVGSCNSGMNSTEADDTSTNSRYIAAMYGMYTRSDESSKTRAAGTDSPINKKFQSDLMCQSPIIRAPTGYIKARGIPTHYRRENIMLGAVGRQQMGYTPPLRPQNDSQSFPSGLQPDPDRAQLRTPGIPLHRTDRVGELNSRKVFVGGLKPSTESASLRQHFSRFGLIKCCGIVKDYRGISKRFGYCEFLEESAVRRLLCMEKHFVDGVSVSVRLYCLRG
jgi:hypothetical protein